MKGADALLIYLISCLNYFTIFYSIFCLFYISLVIIEIKNRIFSFIFCISFTIIFMTASIITHFKIVIQFNCDINLAKKD